MQGIPAASCSAAVCQEADQHALELHVRVSTTVINGIDLVLDVSVGLKAMGSTYMKQAG